MTIDEVKNILPSKIRGATLDDVLNVSDYTMFKHAAANLLREIDPLETVRIYNIPFFDGIYDYTSPSDLKGKKIIDARPQVNRKQEDSFFLRGIKDFDKEKKNFTIEFRDGTKVLRFAQDLGNNILIDSLDINDNASVAGGATNLAEDLIYYTQGSSSLKFDIGATGGYIENTFTAIDLTDHENVSTIFLRVYLPNPSIITSLTLRLGTDSSNYFSITATAPHFSTSFQTGWQWVAFNLNGASETGSVTITSIKYMRLTVVSTASDTDIRIDELRSILPVIYELPYYSRHLFRSTTGTFKETPTADTDIVNLESPGDELFLDECALYGARQLQRNDIRNELLEKLYGNGNRIGDYERYRESLPSEAEIIVSSYYDIV